MKKRNIDSLNSNLKIAILNKDFIQALELIEQGADINAYINHELTLCELNDYDICKLDKFEIAKFMLENGANPNLRDKFHDSTAVHDFTDNHLITKLLVKHGADVKAVTRTGASVLHFLPNIKTAEFLLEHGAQINWSDSPGETALDKAIIYKKLSMIKFYLAKGAAIDSKYINMPIYVSPDKDTYIYCLRPLNKLIIY